MKLRDVKEEDKFQRLRPNRESSNCREPSHHHISSSTRSCHCYAAHQLDMDLSTKIEKIENMATSGAPSPPAYKPPSPLPSTSSNNSSSNAFPFLRLPGELRNRIYDWAIAALDTNLKLKPAQGDENVPWGVLALAQSCQQIRAEFRELLMMNVNIQFLFEDTAPFLETFFQADQVTSFSQVLLIIGFYSYKHGITWDAYALHQARLRSPKTQWELNRFGRSHQDTNRFLYSQFDYAFKYAFYLPVTISDDIKRGFISGLTCKTHARMLTWTLTVAKRSGLDEVEESALNRHCYALCYWSGLRGYAKMMVRVRSPENIHVEEYFWTDYWMENGTWWRRQAEWHLQKKVGKIWYPPVTFGE